MFKIITTTKYKKLASETAKLLIVIRDKNKLLTECISLISDMDDKIDALELELHNLTSKRVIIKSKNN